MGNQYENSGRTVAEISIDLAKDAIMDQARKINTLHPDVIKLWNEEKWTAYCERNRKFLIGKGVPEDEVNELIAEANEYVNFDD